MEICFRGRLGFSGEKREGIMDVCGKSNGGIRAKRSLGPCRWLEMERGASGWVIHARVSLGHKGSGGCHCQGECRGSCWMGTRQEVWRMRFGGCLVLPWRKLWAKFPRPRNGSMLKGSRTMSWSRCHCTHSAHDSPVVFLLH